QEANRLEDEGHRMIKLNIGNPAPFGFEAPEEIVQDVSRHLHESSGYSDPKGLCPARKASMQYCQERQIANVSEDDSNIGTRDAELITMSMQALVHDGDEILLPVPDYPLWTAAVRLAGGNPVHYLCDEQQDWQPALDDIRAKITSRTKALVIIN